MGIDIGKFENEEFENYTLDLSIKGALDFLPDKSFDGVHSLTMIASVRRNMPKRQLNRDEMTEELRRQFKRLLKDDGKVIFFN